MNIVHINEHLALKGGVETYLLSLIPLLEARGVASSIVYGRGEADLHPGSVSVPAIGVAGFRRTTEAREAVRAALEDLNPDVIHIHNVQNVGALQAAVDYGPAVMTTHDYRGICPANTFFYKHTREVCRKKGAGPGCFAVTAAKHCLTPRPGYAAYFYHRSKWTMANAARFGRIVAPSAGAKERFLRAGIAEEQIDVLPYFCPVPPLADPRPIPEQPMITFMGRIAPNKGQEHFVRALGLLPDEVRGTMVGNFDAHTEPAVRALAKEHGCEHRLELRPWASRAEVQSILDRTTVFVFPSVWPETLGIVGLEALARGVPVVASEIGGVREWLRHGVNGVLASPGSADEIAGGVARILSSQETVRQFGEAGIRTIRERFLPDDHADRLASLYEEVFAARAVTSPPE